MNKEQLLAKIAEGLKLKGLPLAEDAIESVLEVFENVVTEYVETSPSKIDDMGLPIVKLLFALAKKQADKLDGVIEDEKKI